MPHALIIVPDEDARRHLVQAVRARGFSVSTVTNVEAGLTRMENRLPDILFLEGGFRGRSRDILLDRVRNSVGGVAVLVGPDGSGVDRGAPPRPRGDPRPPFPSYLPDPLEQERLEAILRAIPDASGVPPVSVEAEPPLNENGGEPDPSSQLTDGALQGLRGSSPCMQRLRFLVTRVAPSRASVLVSGESGAGKERVARTIHDLSPRRRAPFVAVNCGAISATLMESQIFGHEKGSFSGATHRHRGLFEQAHGGTLLLDEITEMPLELQVKLLRVLESGSVVRVGAERALKVDVRILATTNRRPQEAMTEGKLRADLFYRLRILKVEVPPLRERLEDLPALTRTILAEVGAAEGQKKSMGPDLIRILQGYRWPGNVRELRNAIYTAYLLSEGQELDPACLPEEVTGACRLDPEPGLRAIRIPVETTLREAERQLILMTLGHMEGRKDRTAEALGVSLKTLYNRLHAYGCMGSNGDGPSS